jgi:hypothetical protein
VPFPKFGIKLRENQSADAFMIEIEKRVNVMIGEYTMNEYKAYKDLVKHKKRINRVFTEVCGEKSFSSRGPGPKLKVPAIAVGSSSTAPINAPRIRSSNRGSSSVSERTSSGVKPSRTRSLESSKRKRKTYERTSDAELQAASSLAQMSRKKLKKAVKKVSSTGVRRVPSAFDDDVFVGADSHKGFCFWPTERAPLLEVREVVPEDQAPSPSLAAFNKSFGTSYRDELLSVGFETTSVGSKMSKVLTLWKSPVLVDETGGESSEQAEGAA